MPIASFVADNASGRQPCRATAVMAVGWQVFRTEEAVKAIIGLVILAVVLLIWLFKLARRVGKAVYDEAFPSALPRAHRARARAPDMSSKAVAAMNACAGTLTLQLDLARADPRKLLSDRWALGYMFGFHDGIMQRAGISEDGDEGVAFLNGSYVAMFDDPQVAATIVATSLMLQGDPDFDEGGFTGGSEAFQFLDKQQPPLGLSEHLFAVERRERSDVSPPPVNERARTTEHAPRSPAAASMAASGAAWNEHDSVKWLLVPLALLATLVLAIRVLGPSEVAEQHTERWAAPASVQPGTAGGDVAVPSAQTAASELLDDPAPTNAAVDPVPVRPSFECVGELTTVEATICGSRFLSELDSTMSALYERLLPLAASPELLQQDQREWLRDVRAICDREACLETAYRDRNAVLRKALE